MARLRRRHRVGTLDGLDYEGLCVRVIDLTLVMINDSIHFVGQVWLVVPGLRQNHDLSVHVGVTSPLVHVLLTLALC